MTRPDPEQVVAQQIVDATKAHERAHAVWQQAIRDALAQGVEPATIAALIGARDGIDDLPAERTQPTERALLPAAVFLRGARVPEAEWDPILEAMWARGWHTPKQRTDAWHLARGRLPVVLVDFSTRDSDEIRVGLITAKNGEDGSLQLRTPYADIVPTPRLASGERDADAIARMVAKTLGTVSAIKAAALARRANDTP